MPYFLYRAILWSNLSVISFGAILLPSPAISADQHCYSEDPGSIHAIPEQGNCDNATLTVYLDGFCYVVNCAIESEYSLFIYIEAPPSTALHLEFESLNESVDAFTDAQGLFTYILGPFDTVTQPGYSITLTLPAYPDCTITAAQMPVEPICDFFSPLYLMNTPPHQLLFCEDSLLIARADSLCVSDCEYFPTGYWLTNEFPPDLFTHEVFDNYDHYFGYLYDLEVLDNDFIYPCSGDSTGILDISQFVSEDTLYLLYGSLWSPGLDMLSVFNYTVIPTSSLTYEDCSLSSCEGIMMDYEINCGWIDTGYCVLSDIPAEVMIHLQGLPHQVFQIGYPGADSMNLYLANDLGMLDVVIAVPSILNTESIFIVPEGIPLCSMIIDLDPAACTTGPDLLLQATMPALYTLSLCGDEDFVIYPDQLCAHPMIYAHCYAKDYGYIIAPEEAAIINLEDAIAYDPVHFCESDTIGLFSAAQIPQEGEYFVGFGIMDTVQGVFQSLQMSSLSFTLFRPDILGDSLMIGCDWEQGIPCPYDTCIWSLGDTGDIISHQFSFDVEDWGWVDIYNSEGCVVRDSFWVYMESCSISRPGYDPDIQIIPNPAQTSIQLYSTRYTITPGRVSLFDISGQAVMDRQNYAGKDLDISLLPEGMYLLIYEGQKKTISQKCIISRP